MQRRLQLSLEAHGRYMVRLITRERDPAALTHPPELTRDMTQPLSHVGSADPDFLGLRDAFGGAHTHPSGSGLAAAFNAPPSASLSAFDAPCAGLAAAFVTRDGDAGLAALEAALLPAPGAFDGGATDAQLAHSFCGVEDDTGAPHKRSRRR